MNLRCRGLMLRLEGDDPSPGYTGGYSYYAPSGLKGPECKYVYIFVFEIVHQNG